RGQREYGRNICVRERDFLALGIDQADHRTQVLAAGAALLRIHHDRGRQAGHFVDLALHGDAVDEVLELDETRHFGHDRVGVRVPGGHDLAGLDRIAVLHRDHGAVRDLVTLTLATELVDHAELAGARGRDPVALLVVHGLEGVQTRGALALGFHRVRSSSSRRRTTDVERTHRQLRAGFTDGLRGDDADRLTHVDAMTTRKVTAIALRAHAVAGFAG